jgi:hypothetical protein
MIDSSKGYEGNAYIHTPAGRFYMAKPTWQVPSIAHALAQNARYNGNAREFYSVAEHAVLVSLLMEELKLGDPYEGLHHDDTESVMSDVPSPWKHLLPDWQRIDKGLERDMRSTFGLPLEKSEGCQRADWLALFLEADTLIPEHGADFVDPNNLRPEALKLRDQGWHINCYSWKKAKKLFLDRHDELVRRR